MYNTIKKMVFCGGISSREKNISAIIADEMKPYCDECRNDALGNLICFSKGTAPDGERKKIMLCAHMDEIGFMATYIEESGLVRIATIGGINLAAAAFTQVVFENGVKGVIVPDSGVGAGEYSADKFGVDIGASNRAEAERRVKIGDSCALVQTVFRLGTHRISGRPLDDRIGCAVIAETAKKVYGKHRDDIWYVFSVQEEVGLRGSKTAGFAVAPDVAIVFDVTGTGDTAGAKPMACALGGGAAVKIRDASVICDPAVTRKLLNIAKDNKIPAQTEVLISGGTDTASIQMAGAGCAAAAISIPTRYIHSGVETADLRDFAACVDLTVAYILGE